MLIVNHIGEHDTTFSADSRSEIQIIKRLEMTDPNCDQENKTLQEVALIHEMDAEEVRTWS
jgi:hypothetical protein